MWIKCQAYKKLLNTNYVQQFVIEIVDYHPSTYTIRAILNYERSPFYVIDPVSQSAANLILAIITDAIKARKDYVDIVGECRAFFAKYKGELSKASLATLEDLMFEDY